MGKYRVLLVDDEEELVTTLVERLEFRGIEAEAATSGHEALELLGRKSFQVAVIDLKMPGLSGLEVLEVIRRKYPEMKVLLTTGHGSTGEPDEAMPQDAFDILLKPFNIDALIERLHAALGK